MRRSRFVPDSAGKARAEASIRDQAGMNASDEADGKPAKWDKLPYFVD